MNTTTNTRGVSEAMVERAFQAMDAVFAAKWPDREPLDDAEKALACEGLRAALEAALCAPEPAAQGEEGFDARKYVRHMADVLEAGGDLFKVDADLLRLAAAINKAANTAPPAQPAERVPEGWTAWHDDVARTWAIRSPAGDVCEVHDRAGDVHAEVLRQLAQDLASPAPSPARGDGGEGCDVCGGDCAGASPPVIHCPMKDTRP